MWNRKLHLVECVQNHLDGKCTTCILQASWYRDFVRCLPWYWNLKSDDQDNKCVEKHIETHLKIVLDFIWPPNRNKYNSRIFGKKYLLLLFLIYHTIQENCP